MCAVLLLATDAAMTHRVDLLTRIDRQRKTIVDVGRLDPSAEPLILAAQAAVWAAGVSEEARLDCPCQLSHGRSRSLRRRTSGRSDPFRIQNLSRAGVAQSGRAAAF